MADQLAAVKLAAVQAASVFLDRAATVDKACRLITEAGEAGADLIGFPESFIPAHPTWYAFLPSTSQKAFGLAKRLFQNAVEIPGPATEQLAEACREARITAVIGLCEKRPGTTGTMYNTQLFIGPGGTILGKHQKLVPTLGEQLVHTGGWGDTLLAYDAPFSRVSGLICGENSNPLAMHVMSAMNTVVHVAAWPPHFDRGNKMQDNIPIASQGLAYTIGSFVINSVGVVAEDAIEACTETNEDRAYLEECRNEGGASIIGPRGQVLAGPMEPGEGILYADVDLNDVLVPKIGRDVSGHYNRFDIFSLTVDRRAREALTFLTEGSESKGET